MWRSVNLEFVYKIFKNIMSELNQLHRLHLIYLTTVYEYGQLYIIPNRPSFCHSCVGLYLRYDIENDNWYKNNQYRHLGWRTWSTIWTLTSLWSCLLNCWEALKLLCFKLCLKIKVVLKSFKLDVKFLSWETDYLFLCS